MLDLLMVLESSPRAILFQAILTLYLFIFTSWMRTNYPNFLLFLFFSLREGRSDGLCIFSITVNAYTLSSRPVTLRFSSANRSKSWMLVKSAFGNSSGSTYVSTISPKIPLNADPRKSFDWFF